jgi:hypothetical protein
MPRCRICPPTTRGTECQFREASYPCRLQVLVARAKEFLKPTGNT